MPADSSNWCVLPNHPKLHEDLQDPMHGHKEDEDEVSVKQMKALLADTAPSVALVNQSINETRALVKSYELAEKAATNQESVPRG